MVTLHVRLGTAPPPQIILWHNLGNLRYHVPVLVSLVSLSFYWQLVVADRTYKANFTTVQMLVIQFFNC